MNIEVMKDWRNYLKWHNEHNHPQITKHDVDCADWLIAEVERLNRQLSHDTVTAYESGRLSAARECAEIAQAEAYDDMSEYDLAVGHIVEAIRKEFGL